MSKENQNHDDEKEENNPNEPFYHSTDNFNSAYFGKVPEHVLTSVPQKYDNKLIATLVSQLTDPRYKEMKEEVLTVLKNGKAQDLLVEVIGMKAYGKFKPALVAACWETGLDFSMHLPFFVQEAVNGDYETALEAMTVITENMQGPFSEADIEKAYTLLQPALINTNDERAAIFSQILEVIERAKKS